MTGLTDEQRGWLDEAEASPDKTLHAGRLEFLSRLSGLPDVEQHRVAATHAAFTCSQPSTAAGRNAYGRQAQRLVRLPPA